MKILVVGYGGREHALLWKLRQDAPAAELYVTRGNGGTAELATSLPFDPTAADALAGWAEGQSIDLTVVGPEAPLAAGIVDVFARHGLPILGPSRAAAAIEASKAYAKSLMRRAGVPTAPSAAFTEAGPAERYIRDRGAPLVVKASGLAAGKGVVVCETVEQALAAAHAMLVEEAFGAAGREIVIEDRLEGEEVSVLALADGMDALPLLPAQDYKRIGEGETGPNTGGMGACAPVSLVDAVLLDRIRREILAPTLAALREDGRPFRGVLYAGLMLTAGGPSVLEFNARFGDPETQALLPLLRSSLLEPVLAVARGAQLEGASLDWHPAFALATVLAAAGYPGPSEAGREILIPPAPQSSAGVLLFHAGTRLEDSRLLTTGGRVLAVTAVAGSLAEAAARSRAAAAAIRFEGKQYRRDIGWRELERHARTA
ncbi:MAG: phosphoribosylamine--glycine ligase [Gemmatimonadetes bacterium]|nr:phosphoribosylamine--glycine ligase [Gemmatimonadota bacterium]